jgi:xanthine/uracil/vitamin C permease (AzgA family)
MEFCLPLEEWLGDLFETIRNGSSVRTEIFAGVINFFSCLYCLPVLPEQLELAGYNKEAKKPKGTKKEPT